MGRVSGDTKLSKGLGSCDYVEDRRCLFIQHREHCSTVTTAVGSSLVCYGSDYASKTRFKIVDSAWYSNCSIVGQLARRSQKSAYSILLKETENFHACAQGASELSGWILCTVGDERSLINASRTPSQFTWNTPVAPWLIEIDNQSPSRSGQ